MKTNSTILKKIKNKLPILNVGTNEEITIRDLSKMIAKFIKYRGVIKFDKKSPDGTFRKGLNSSKIRGLGWYPKIKLVDGLREVIEKECRFKNEHIKFIFITNNFLLTYYFLKKFHFAK